MMKLRIARQIARLTQDQLARRADVDSSTIAKLELAEDRYLSAHYQTIVNIARVLNVAPEDVFPVPPLRRRAARGEAPTV
jgi:transcriptional regulator with XRE-family HTH domain